MFEIGDYIVYGNNGVCKVEKIGYLDSSMVSGKKLYYTLNPYYTSGNTIFTPVDNQKVIMRPVLKKNEAEQLIQEIPVIESLWIPDEKKREFEYKQAFGKCDCRELVRIIKTIYLHKKSRMAEGKKVTSVDERYFTMAENNLYGELALPLEMNKEDVKEFVTQTVDQLSN